MAPVVLKTYPGRKKPLYMKQSLYQQCSFDKLFNIRQEERNPFDSTLDSSREHSSRLSSFSSYTRSSFINRKSKDSIVSKLKNKSLKNTLNETTDSLADLFGKQCRVKSGFSVIIQNFQANLSKTSLKSPTPVSSPAASLSPEFIASTPNPSCTTSKTQDNDIKYSTPTRDDPIYAALQKLALCIKDPDPDSNLPKSGKSSGSGIPKTSTGESSTSDQDSLKSVEDIFSPTSNVSRRKSLGKKVSQAMFGNFWSKLRDSSPLVSPIPRVVSVRTSSFSVDACSSPRVSVLVGEGDRYITSRIPRRRQFCPPKVFSPGDSPSHAHDEVSSPFHGFNESSIMLRGCNESYSRLWMLSRHETSSSPLPALPEDKISIRPISEDVCSPFHGFNENSLAFQRSSESYVRSSIYTRHESPGSSLPALVEDEISSTQDEQDSGSSPSESGQESPLNPISGPLRRQDSKESECSGTSSSEDESSSRSSGEMSARRYFTRSTKTASLGFITEESEVDAAASERDHLAAQEEALCLMQGKKTRRSISIIHSLRDVESSFASSNLVEKGRRYQDSVKQLIQMQGRGERKTWQSLCRPSMASPVCHSKKSVIAPRASMSFFRRDSVLRSLCELPEITQSPQSFQTTVLETCIEEITHGTIVEETLEETVLCTNETVTSPLSESSTNTEGEVCFSSFLDGIKFICGQEEACSFDEVFGDARESVKKIGEGVFGEVFALVRDKKTVLKIVPAEGDIHVNGEPQKTYAELFTELSITLLLHNMKTVCTAVECSGFVEIVKSWLIIGKYPPWLIGLWKNYDKEVGSENDSPTIFPDNQMYLGYELANSGISMESYVFSTARQGLSAFKQVVYSLAVAEEFEFEHRDLHWGNVLISRTTDKKLVFKRGSHEFSLNPGGVKATIIDYTLSAITQCGQRYYTDLSKDPELFMGKGDYQFEVYRQMKSDLSNTWDSYAPKTNVRWLYYLVDKLIEMVHYQRKKAAIHTSSLEKLKEIRKWISDSDSAFHVALRLP